jgi:hypothetical protein
MTIVTSLGALRVRADTLRRGDLVEVRSAGEILHTLDQRGALEALPFMPEMVAYCGRRFIVERRTEKVCDAIQYSGVVGSATAFFSMTVRCAERQGRH